MYKQIKDVNAKLQFEIQVHREEAPSPIVKQKAMHIKDSNLQ